MWHLGLALTHPTYHPLRFGLFYLCILRAARCGLGKNDVFFARYYVCAFVRLCVCVCVRVYGATFLGPPVVVLYTAIMSWVVWGWWLGVGAALPEYLSSDVRQSGWARA